MIATRLHPVRNFLLTVCLLASGLVRVHAQTDIASPALNTAMLRLFGSITAFSAHLEIRMTDAKGNETLNAPMKFSLLDGKMRGDLDVTKMKSKDLPAFAASAAKSVGMERVVTLVRPDMKETYLIYPAFQACVVALMDDVEVDALKKPARLEKTPLGKETIDGHACIKSKVIVTDATGEKQTATIWCATSLKDFPVQIRTVDGADTTLMKFSQVKFEKPDAKLFDLPKGTAKYTDAQDLTKAVMKKLLIEALGK